MILYFVSSNLKKHQDVARIFGDSESPPRSLMQPLVEVLSSDLETIVKEKARVAYKQALVPLLVEHGALYIDYLNGLPGPLVKLFWEKLGDRLPSLLPATASRRAEVIQMVCYCDEKKLHVYKGQIRGTIAEQKRGSEGIHWEPMFIPDGHEKTLGEMQPDERIAAQAATLAYKALRKDLGI
jgi:XTP/dITP diphosphohydrolase